ncbi:MAG: hypothetical protein MSA91_04935 [Lachnobacterium sp.]|nr:hypothetical protein [Lachnobacterium sp.]
MDLINQMLNNSQLSFDPLGFLGTVVTVITSVYILKSETSMSFTKQRYEKLIFPLFNILEPVLYQTPDKQILDKALKLIDENKNLADGKLIERAYFCSINPSLENFKALCSYSNYAYDRSCRKLGLKTRSLLYRYTRKQFKNKLGIVLFILRYTLFGFAIIISTFLFSLFVFIAIITIYGQANSSSQLFMLCGSIPLIFLIYKYMTKNS